MAAERGLDHQEHVATVDVRERTCSVDGCSSPVAATYSMVRPIAPGKVTYEAVWSCADHKVNLVILGDKRMAEGSLITGWGQDLLPVCLAENCAADATHAVLVARDYSLGARRLEAMSLCSAHARQIESDLSAD